ncbi:MAG: GNAT family N-acetyltransferase [Caulobacter sp.]|nr:GNAT family N-acetyltransferase [Caulobacter sp.]
MAEGRVVDTLAAIDRDAWDALFPGETERYDYLAAVEAAGLDGFAWRYVLVEEDGRLLAAAPAFITRYALETTVEGATRSVLRALGCIAPGLVSLRMACLGSPCTETAQIGLAEHKRGSADRQLLMRTLLATFDAAARADRCSLSSIKDLPALEVGAWGASLAHAGYHSVTGLPSAELEIDFPDIETYLSRLSPATRKDMRRKLRAAGNVRIEIRRNLDGLEDQVLALYAETRARGDLQFETLTADYFTGVLERMGERAACVLYFVEDRLLAANLVLLDNGILLDKFFCMSAQGRDHNLYFLSWFTNVQLCLDRGLRGYRSGQAAYVNKVRLGSRLTPVTMYFRHRNPFVDGVLRALAPLLAPDAPDATLPKPSDPPPVPATFRSRWARRLLFLALPLLGLAYQVTAMETARAMTGVPFGAGWLLTALRLPWAQALVALEILAFAVWMVVLSEVKLSEAFPLSALSYVLVVAASWTFFHEPASLLQVLGGAAIMAGVWLIGRSSEPSSEEPAR